MHFKCIIKNMSESLYITLVILNKYQGPQQSFAAFTADIYFMSQQTTAI